MKVCPKCGREFDRLLAVSRVDNRTMICDTCGNMEALEAMGGGIVTRKKVLKAYNLIKKYCLQGECAGCLFESENKEYTDCLLLYEGPPRKWPEMEEGKDGKKHNRDITRNM